MINIDETSFFVIVGAAALAALLVLGIGRWAPIPVVVVELVLGIVIGPQVLDLAQPDDFISFFAELGLGMLFFFAGFEIDFQRIRGAPLKLAAIAWGLSLVLAYGIGGLLALAGIVLSFVYTGSALATTAIGTLLPILRESGELETRFGRFVLGAGAIGEFGPIVLFSLIMAGDQGLMMRSGLLATFVLIALACAGLFLRIRPPHVVDVLSRGLMSTNQLPIRMSMLLLAGLVVLADVLGLDILLGAFAAGTLVGLVARGPGTETFHTKLDAIGFGFLIPIFFVTSGAQMDLPALFASANSLARVPLFLLLLLVVRGAPALLYRSELDAGDQRLLALFSATSLPLIVVITEVGKASGKMQHANAAALVGAGILSVLIFPLIGLTLRKR